MLLQDSMRSYKSAADQARKVSAKREFMVKVLRRQTAKQFPRSHALLEDVEPETETLKSYLDMITLENEVISEELERLQAVEVQTAVCVINLACCPFYEYNIYQYTIHTSHVHPMTAILASTVLIPI